MDVNTTDKQLWESFKLGDRAAFEVIYRAHADALLAYGAHVARNEDVAEDCLQDLFVELWNSRENLGSTSCVKAYLFRALRYKILRTLSTDRYVPLKAEEKLIYQIQSHSCEDILIELEVQSEQMRHLRETLRLLPDRQLEAVSLRYFHNFTNEQVAAVMGISYHSACKHLYAALEKLKENLKLAIY